MLPISVDDVIASATISSNSGIAASVNSFTLDSALVSYDLNIPLTVLTDAIFNGASTNHATITGDVIFNDSSINYASLTYRHVTFNDSSTNL